MSRIIPNQNPVGIPRGLVLSEAATASIRASSEGLKETIARIMNPEATPEFGALAAAVLSHVGNSQQLAESDLTSAIEQTRVELADQQAALESLIIGFATDAENIESGVDLLNAHAKFKDKLAVSKSEIAENKQQLEIGKSGADALTRLRGNTNRLNQQVAEFRNSGLSIPLDTQTLVAIYHGLGSALSLEGEESSPQMQFPQTLAEDLLADVANQHTRSDTNYQLGQPDASTVVFQRRQRQKTIGGHTAPKAHLDITSILTKHQVELDPAVKPAWVGKATSALAVRLGLDPNDPVAREVTLTSVIDGTISPEDESLESSQLLRGLAQQAKNIRLTQKKEAEIPQQVMPPAKPTITGRIEEEIGTGKKILVSVKDDSILGKVFNFKGKRDDPKDRIWDSANPGELASVVYGSKRGKTKAEKEKRKLQRVNVMVDLEKEVKQLISSAKAKEINTLGELESSRQVEMPPGMRYALQKLTSILAQPGEIVLPKTISIEVLARIPHLVRTRAGKETPTMEDFLRALTKRGK